jgi:Centrosome microtubule-binding domain of Cep57
LPLVFIANDRQYRNLASQYEGLEPGHGKRKRKAIAEKLRDILEEFEAKADQIYALYDVVEGARLDGMGSQSRRGWLEL